MTLQLAMLGCGNIAEKHASRLKKLKLPVDLTFASRDAEKSRSMNEQMGGAGSFDSYQTACANDQTDAVFICTPPHLHLELALIALAAGKHVIVEKPPFFNTADFDQVRQAASDADRQLLIAENYFYRPVAIKIREIIHSGMIGQPLMVQVNAMKTQKVEDWRGDQDISGGGALFEGGIHWINFMNNLGLTTADTAILTAQQDQPDRTSVVSFRYDEGAVGNLMYSWEVPSLFQGLRLSRIYGSKGSILFESNGLWLAVIGQHHRLSFPGLRDINGFDAMLRDFVGALLENRPALFTPELARRDLEVLGR